MVYKGYKKLQNAFLTIFILFSIYQSIKLFIYLLFAYKQLISNNDIV